MPQMSTVPIFEEPLVAENTYVETPDLEVSFICTVRGGHSDDVVISWSGSAGVALPDPTTVQIFDGVFMSNLTLTNVTTAFTGLYYCTAAHDNSLCTKNVSSKASLHIIATGKPTITNQRVSPVRVDSGTNISLCFEFSALPSHTDVQCSGPDGAIETNVGISLARSDNNTAFQIRLDISINSINYTRGGQYFCTANNSAGDITATTLLLVRPVVEPREVLAKNGDNITLMCLAQSSPEPSYVWEMLRKSSDNDTIPDVFGFVSGSGENMMATYPFLDFEPVGYGDVGVYRCVVNISGTWIASSDPVLLAGKVQNNS